MDGPWLYCIKCRTWRVLREDTVYCDRCGDRLGTEDFQELLALNRAAAAETPEGLAQEKYVRLWAMSTFFRPSVGKP